MKAMGQNYLSSMFYVNCIAKFCTSMFEASFIMFMFETALG